MNIDIPGLRAYKLKHIFIDYNGTIAKNGRLIDGILNKLHDLSNIIDIYVITGDTFGDVKKQLENTNLKLIHAYTAKEKQDKLYPNSIAMGNGSIDHLMFKEAELSFCIIGEEGASFKAIQEADIIVNNVFDALDMILEPKKIIATLKE